MNLIKYCFYLVSSLSIIAIAILPIAAEESERQFSTTIYQSLYISRPNVVPGWLSVGKFRYCLPSIPKRSLAIALLQTGR